MGLFSILRRSWWRLTGYPAGRYQRLLETSQHWSPQELQEYRNSKLRFLIIHAHRNVPYYRRIMDERQLLPTDFEGVQDLYKLPVLTKDIVRQHARDLLSTTAEHMKISWGKTGGTTGEPMRIARNRECTAWSAMCSERGFRWGGWSVDKPRVVLVGGSLGLESVRYTTMIGNIFRRDLFLPAFELRDDTAPLFFERIRRSGAQFIKGYSSAIFRLAVLARERKEAITFAAAFPTAEMLLPHWERTIREVFCCDVLPYYGCGEVNALGYHSPESGAYLIPEEHALIEIMTEHGTAPYGDGQFLVTDLDNFAMPMIRYANGDAGLVSGSDARTPFSRIERLDGRYNSLLLTDSGDLISGVIGTHVFRHMRSVRNYLIIQEEPLKVVIRIVPNGDLDEAERSQIERVFQEHLGRRMDIRIELATSIPVPPSGKSQFVVNQWLETSAS